MKTPTRINVLLAEDHTVVREGLHKLLKMYADIEVVGEADTGRVALDMARTLRPDVVIMDIAMPSLNGLEATRHIRKAVPDTQVIILSAHSDDAYVDRALALGAAGYLVKQTSAQFLAEAIRAVHQGHRFFSPTVSSRLLKRNAAAPNRTAGIKPADATLSPREVEVLQLIAEGKANKQTAAELGISIKTVEKHRDNLMRKLNIHDTAGLTRYAAEVGVIELTVQLTME